MSFYDNASATARRLIAQFGQNMTVISPSGDPVYDPDTGIVTTPTPTTQIDKGVILPYKNSEINKPDSLIHQDDQKVLINLTDAPVVNGTVTVGSTVYTIVNIQALSPAGQAVLYTLQVRK